MLTDEDVARSGYDTRFKMNPPLRGEADRAGARLGPRRRDDRLRRDGPRAAPRRREGDGVRGGAVRRHRPRDGALRPPRRPRRPAPPLALPPRRGDVDRPGAPLRPAVRDARRGRPGRRRPLLDVALDDRASSLPLPLGELPVGREDAAGAASSGPSSAGARSTGSGGPAAERPADAGRRALQPSEPPPPCPSTDASAVSAPAKRIVLVDDSTRSTPPRGGRSSRTATATGSPSRRTRTRVEALAQLGPDVDLLLVDLEMPVLDGRSVARLAKERGVSEKRIVIVSGARRRRAPPPLPAGGLPRGHQQDRGAAAERLPDDPRQHRLPALMEGSRALEAAVEAARRAGDLLLGYFGSLDPSEVEEKGRNDVVSRADRESEALVKEILLGAFPGDLFVGEEGGVDGIGRGRPRLDRRPARRHGELRPRLPALGRLDRADGGRTERRARPRRRLGPGQERPLRRREGLGRVPERPPRPGGAARRPRGRRARDRLPVPDPGADRHLPPGLQGGLPRGPVDPSRRERGARPRLRLRGHLRRLLRAGALAVGLGRGGGARDGGGRASSPTSTAAARGASAATSSRPGLPFTRRS